MKKLLLIFTLTFGLNANAFDTIGWECTNNPESYNINLLGYWKSNGNLIQFYTEHTDGSLNSLMNDANTSYAYSEKLETCKKNNVLLVIFTNKLNERYGFEAVLEENNTKIKLYNYNPSLDQRGALFLEINKLFLIF